MSASVGHYFKAALQRHLASRRAHIQVFCAVCMALLVMVKAADADPPSRVARVSYVSGNVLVQPADTNEWAQARLNRPLTNNDELWTDGGARAELQVGNSALQLDENTQLSVLELSDNVIQLQLSQGSANLHVRGLEQDETVELDTPNAAATVQEPGTYRIQVDSSGDLTVVQVRAGSVEVSGERQSFSLRENEQVTLRGTTRLAAEFDQLGRLDDFERWAAARNERGDHVVAAQYVSSDVTGYEDLDTYGYWQYEPDYGQVWIPNRVIAGWSPYRYGHWDWIDPWGWTWVDDAPWGFAPFHYGRWAQVRNNWCWVPGPRESRAIYAPALVAWVGTPGLNVSVAVGSRPVGWVPLGPREIYRPGYRGSDRYVERVNLSSSLLRRDEFERDYRRAPHDANFTNRAAATVVSADALRSARPVNRNLVRADFNKLQPSATGPNIRPDRVTMMGGQGVAPPPQVTRRDVIARRAPAPLSGDQAASAPNGLRGQVRLVEPPSLRRPMGGEQGGQRPGPSLATPLNQPQPRNEPGPARFMRPQDNAQPNGRADEARPDNVRAPNGPDGVEQQRATRRGLIAPRNDSPDSPDIAPSAQRPTQMVAPATAGPERRQIQPRVPNNVEAVRPSQREAPTPEIRSRVNAPPQQQIPAPPVAPRAEAPVQRAAPQSPVPRAQSNAPPEARRAPAPATRENATQEEKREKLRESESR